MARAPFQVLVFPYRIIDDNKILYAVFRRVDAGYWQGIAGGGEDDETPLEAARREAFEEAGIDAPDGFIELDSHFTVPAEEVAGMIWGQKVLVLPECCFGVEVKDETIVLSDEHDAFRWLNYEAARTLLHWDSNKNALWELDYRLRRFLLGNSESI
jgi:dATP pyrophosphohydrolase